MAQAEKPAAVLEEQDGAIVIRLTGTWRWSERVPAAARFRARLEKAAVGTELVVDASGVAAHDSTLTGFILALQELARARELAWKPTGIPSAAGRMIELASAVPERAGAARRGDRAGLVARVGRSSLELYDGALELAAFTGSYVEAIWRILRGRGNMRWGELWLIIQRVGVDALPIVSLISFLVGLIISFLGAVTLKQFGAEFAVAYLVGYGMLREMGAIMTGIILAGRTGAAFAAEIASMKVNEEIDALRTFGISPIDYLVVPRIVAMGLMMPLLVAYANVIGIIGGWLVAEFLMGVPANVFFEEMKFVVGVPDLLLGLFKGLVFGLLVATSGCLRGLQSGSGASAVGQAATRAVVSGITLIIIATAIIDWAAATLGI